MRPARGPGSTPAPSPEVQRIVLLDAPAVLGWERWREVGMRHGMGMVRRCSRTRSRPAASRASRSRPLAHVLIGALDEAAIYLARSDGSAKTRKEVDTIIDRLIDAVLAG